MTHHALHRSDRRRSAPCVLALLGLAAMLASGAASADGTGSTALYVGGSVGPARVQYEPDTFYAGSSGTGYQIDVGTQPIPEFAAELDYLGLPRAFSGANYVDTYGAGLSALAILPIPVIDVFGKVGLLDWRSRVRSELIDFDRSGTNLSYGGGIGTSWGHLGARLEFERFDIPHAREMQLTSIGLTWALL